MNPDMAMLNMDQPVRLIEWHGTKYGRRGLRVVLQPRVVDGEVEALPHRLVVEALDRDTLGGERWSTVGDKHVERNILALAAVAMLLLPTEPFEDGGPLALWVSGHGWLFDRRDLDDESTDLWHRADDPAGEGLDPEELAAAYGDDPR